MNQAVISESCFGAGSCSCFFCKAGLKEDSETSSETDLKADSKTDSKTDCCEGNPGSSREVDSSGEAGSSGNAGSFAGWLVGWLTATASGASIAGCVD